MANPVGEESWLAYIDETVRNASDLEQRVNVVELYKRAVDFEPGSMQLWLAYCNYFWSLWADSQSSDAGWSEEEQMMGRELFSFGAALDLWQQGYEAIKYRLDDSHTLWDRWISLEMELLAKTRTPDGVQRITQLYRNRLSTPHLTWADTSQAFSSFLSEYNQAAWEDSMKDVTTRAQGAKRLIDARDPFELKLGKAARSGDIEAQKSIMAEYLEWEMMQSKRNNDQPEIALDLCRGLYARALSGILSTDEATWLDYLVFLSSSHGDSAAPENLLDVLRRAVQHCPWSGRMWNRYVLCAEEAKLAFAEIESIKHAATSEDQLYRDGMESMIEMYVAWCGFLKRNAMDASVTDEAVDVADVGLRAALEDVAVVGKRLYGKDFQGDPKFRLERIYIQYLTEKKGSIEEARGQWNKLGSVQVHADSYDFWFRYYMWEMLIFSSNPQPLRSPTPSSGGLRARVPTLATAVLSRAASRRTIDWPEKVLEVYLQHCNDYELPAAVRSATDFVHKVGKAVAKRRDQDEREKQAAYAAYYSAQEPSQVAPDATADLNSPSGSKRKREPAQDADEEPEGATKRQKGDSEESGQQQPNLQGPKRDRENATVVVTNLPSDVTQTKVRQYFKEFGHINHLTALVKDQDGQSSTALIEFSSVEEARSALLRDGKYFGQSQISVQSGYDLTVYVANYPPVADEKYIRDLFQGCGQILSVRLPSLRVNTHRRFCYVSFRDREASAKAVKMEGTVLDGRYKLLAKYSDPGHKKSREGAVAEGREIHVTNLDRSVTEAELRDVFSKSGKVTRVNIPVSLGGKNRGFAYLDFETKEQAEQAARDMNNVKLSNQIIKVEVSMESKVKAIAKSVNPGRDSASPAPSSRDGDAAMEDSPDLTRPNPTASEISARTVALMGLPDTVNDARVRALVEPLGTIVKLVLQPSHGGAKIEFADAATAGKAGLELNSMEFEGQKLRTGSLDELRRAKAERQEDRIVYGTGSKEQKAKTGASAPKASTLMAPPSVRRPVPGRPGPKRGLGFGFKKTPAGGAAKPSEDGSTSEGVPAPKSNADFKAMFLASGTNGDKNNDEQKKSDGN